MKLLQQIFSLFRERPICIILSALLILLSGISESAAVLSLKNIFSPNPRHLAFSVSVLNFQNPLFLAIFLFSIFYALRLFSSYAWITFTSAALVAKSDRAFMSAFKLNTFRDTDYYKQQYAALSSNQDEIINGFLVPLGNLLAAFSSSFFLILVLALSLTLSSILIILILVLILFSISYCLRGRQSRIGELILKYKKDLLSIITQCGKQPYEIICFNNYLMQGSRFHSANFNLRRMQGLSYFYSLLPRSIIEFGAILVIVVFSTFSLLKMPSLSSLVVIIYSMQKILPYILSMVTNYGYLVTYSHSFVWINRESSFAIGKDFLINYSIPKNHGHGDFRFSSLVLSDLAFGISDNIRSFNISLQSGEKLIINGPSGSGKSTLLSIISGRLQPSNGTILINGLDLYSPTNENIRRYWLNKTFYLSQNMPLDEGTVASNVCYGTPLCSINYTKVKYALQKVSLSDLCDFQTNINRLITDNPPNLSGGQRQRLILSRSFYLNHSVMFLDEPTSALDPVLSESILPYLLDQASDLFVMSTHKNYNCLRGLPVFSF